MGFNRKKIILTISCLLNIVCIWIALAIQIRHDYRQTKEAAETNVYNLTKAFEEHINNRVKDIDGLLLNLRTEYMEDSANFNLKDKHIRELGYDNLHIHISVINKEGIVVYADQPTSGTPLENSERKQFVKSLGIRNDSLFINRPLLDNISDKWNLQFTRKSYRKDGSFFGILIASTPPSFFSDFFQSVNIGNNGALTLFGTDAYILATATGRKNIEEATGLQLTAEHPFVSKKVQNGIYSSKSNIDGVPRLSAFKKLQKYPLLVQVSLSEEDIFLNTSKRKRNILVLGTIISVGLLGALAVLLQFEGEQQKLLDKVSKRDEQLSNTLTELEHLAATDLLTGLPNRRSFFTRAHTEFTRSKRYDHPLSLVMIDVDHFKEVNDQHGHIAGDAALRHISEIMQGCIRDSDMVARYGGEEFVLILPETDAEGAHFIAERIRTDIEASRIKIEPATELAITVSLGIACMSRENQFPDIDKLLQKADDAMYRAKTGGRNRIFMAAHPTSQEMARRFCET